MSVKRLKKNLKNSSVGKSKASQRIPLSSRIEVERQSPTSDQSSNPDSLDQNVLQYVEEFLKSYSNIPPMEHTSLLTKEGAQKALTVITAAQEQIQAHLRTAKALKQVLEAKKSDSGNEQ